MTRLRRPMENGQARTGEPVPREHCPYYVNNRTGGPILGSLLLSYAHRRLDSESPGGCMKRHRSHFALLCLLFCSAPADAQFSLIYPSMPTASPVEIVFLDSATGFFSNAAGTIYKTRDSGASWFRCAHYQGDPISMLRFVDPSLGLGASPHSHLWLDKVNCVYTTNGGNGWDPTNVDLSDASDFLPFSGATILKGCLPGIKRLDNVFGLWTETYRMPWYVPGDVGMPYGTVRKLLRVSDTRVVALVSFENAKRDHILTDSLNLLLQSGDQGASWDTLWQGLQTIMSAVAFVSDSIGWMGGANGTILKTTNGGRSWAAQLSDSLSESVIQQIVALDTLRIFAVSQDGRVFRSTNGGSTWLSLLVDEYGAWGFETKRRIAFANPMRGFYAGSELYVTTDGGSSWRPAFGRIHEEAFHMEFLNRRLGWVLTSGGFYASTDCGASWTRRVDNPGWLHFDMIDTVTGWAVGRYQRAKTTDGGFTW
ncbi:hypothetical protein EHM92_05775, partial [bacterium]